MDTDLDGLVGSELSAAAMVSPLTGLRLVPPGLDVMFSNESRAVLHDLSNPSVVTSPANILKRSLVASHGVASFKALEEHAPSLFASDCRPKISVEFPRNRSVEASRA